MTTALITHPICLEHETGPHHPESADRLRAVLAALEEEAFAPLLRETAPEATLEQLARVHPLPYVEAILDIRPAARELVQIDDSTFMGAHSVAAALRAAGAAVAAVDAVMEGWARSAFAAVRPPGHHAAQQEPGGFCLFNNVAVAALHARERWGVARIAVVDFDVHHGQGTQAIFEADPGLFYASSHQSPLYPGTGSARERGVAGNIVNVPLPPGAGSAEFRAAWEGHILPLLDNFAPGLLIVSAGFDGHRRDPLANLSLETEDFTWITEKLMALADRHCQGRLVSALEGGYDLDALGKAVAAHVLSLMRAA
ncbi:histone deacetylase family protein [Oceanibaculum pacificum]|uniref:Acetoin utilization protein n=1 Tax=Oceanibaculum pacificum TaxID=580166 RepID=A0A154WG90_9PROT|nr:histone deacetylase family protein [Oceanibaculum pacificum]KZD12541.1 acetoin utilization protein [Oceanibaculum pacificum]